MAQQRQAPTINNARDDRHHANDDLSVRVFLEHDPGNHRGQNTLDVENQRCRRSTPMRQDKHQQRRSKHWAEDDGAEQPWDLYARDSQWRCCLPRATFKRLPQGKQHAQTQSAAEVEQAGQQQRGHVAHEQLADGMLAPNNSAAPRAGNAVRMDMPRVHHRLPCRLEYRYFIDCCVFNAFLTALARSIALPFPQ